MTDIDAVTLEAEVGDEDAARDIAEAVSARHSIARKHVLRLRRRRPDATPSEVIQMLERHYTTAITTAGAAITAGGIALSLMPVAGVAKAGHQGAKLAVKTAAKGLALNAAKNGAERLLPAGEQQLQFELTAIFGLAIADIHGIDYDKDQAHALVYGLTNERVSQQQVAKMASDVAGLSSEGMGDDASASPADGAQWASTLAAALPGGAAQSLVRTMQTGHLDTVRESMSGKQQAAVDYGVKAVAGGVTRFVFGREVVASARSAFPEAPADFPAHLTVPLEDDDTDATQNRALAAMEDAAKATGTWIADAAGTVGSGVATGTAAVGTGVATAAGTVTRAFRRVDLDGDGIPDEPQALTAVKGVGGVISGAADAVGGGVAGLFKSRKRG